MKFRENISKFIIKNRAVLITLLIIAVSFAGVYGILHSRGYAEEKNPNETFNEERSLVYVTGDPYSLSEEREEEFIEREQELESEPPEKSEFDEILDQVETENNDGSIDSGSGSGNGGSGTGTGNTGEKTKAPKITCSLSEQSSFNGQSVYFDVKAVDYRGNVLSSFNIETMLNGHKLYGSADSTNTYTTYRNSKYVNDGVNEVVITVSDSEGNTATKKYAVNVNTAGEREEDGVLSIRIEAKSIGKGVLAKDSAMKIYKDESVAEVAKRFFEQNGFTIGGDADFEDGGYFMDALQKPGISAGWSIPQGLVDMCDTPVTEGGWWLALGDCSSPDSLGSKDFTDNSGWMYMLDGVTPGKGMSGMKAEDGMSIVIFFTLNFGNEYSGENFLY